ncbi:hypothetical protein ABPG74_007941 [Tetrahymena malaccensis]
MNIEDFLNSFGNKGKKQEEDIEKTIVEFINNEASDRSVDTKCITKLLIAFQMNQINLFQFFEKLGFYFVNGREKTRQRATEMIYLFFSRYSGFQMTQEEVQSLYSFFLTKLFDVATVKSANKVLLELLKNVAKHQEQMKQKIDSKKDGAFKEFKFELAKQFIDKISDSKFNISQYSQDVRDCIYINLRFLQENFTESCKELGASYVKVIIESTEDEKDPRCIIKSFKLIRFVLENFSYSVLQPFLEDIFDNLECYYPIDFQPDPEQDKKYQISPKDLSEALDLCLINQHILQKTLDIINEKINSSYIDAKLAAMQTYQLVFKKYLPGQLLSSQRKQILNNLIENAQDIEEVELQDKVVDSIKQYVVFITSTCKSDTNIIENTYYDDLKLINKHIFKLLEDGLLHHNAALSEKLMKALIPINQNMNYTIVNSVVKYFNSKYTNKESIVAQRQLEFVLLILLAAEQEIKHSCDFMLNPYFYLDEEKEKNLKNILIGEIQNTNDESIQILSLAILMKLAVYGKASKEMDIEFMKVCEDIGITEVELENYSETVKKCMVEYCYIVNSKLSESQITFLELKLIGLLGQQNMNEMVVNGFNSMILNKSDGWKECFQFIIQNINNRDQQKLINLLLEKVISLNKEYVNKEIYQELIQLDNLIIEDKQTRSQFKTILSKVVKTDCELTEQEQSSFKSLIQKPYESITLFTKLIKKLSKTLDMKEFFTQYSQNLQKSEFINNKNVSSFVLSLSKLFGNKLQKYLSNEEQKQFMGVMKSKIFDKNTSELELKLYSRIFRGLLISMNNEAFQLLSQIIQSETSGESNLPVEFYNTIMNSKNAQVQKQYLFYSPTYAQRLFNTCVEVFYNKLNSIKNDPAQIQLKNKCYLVLTSTLLVSPFSILKINKSISLPILIEALTFSSDSQGLESAIKLLTRLINTDLNVIGSSSESLINCLLKLLQQQNNSVSCTIEIIKCLAECIRFEYHLVKRYKKEVIDILDKYLSHKKRPVRRHAVYTVNQWHMII